MWVSEFLEECSLAHLHGPEIMSELSILEEPFPVIKNGNGRAILQQHRFAFGCISADFLHGAPAEQGFRLFETRVNCVLRCFLLLFLATNPRMEMETYLSLVTWSFRLYCICSRTYRR